MHISESVTSIQIEFIPFTKDLYRRCMFHCRNKKNKIDKKRSIRSSRCDKNISLEYLFFRASLNYIQILISRMASKLKTIKSKRKTYTIHIKPALLHFICAGIIHECNDKVLSMMQPAPSQMATIGIPMEENSTNT